MALSLMRASDPFTKANMHGIKRPSPFEPLQWQAAKHQRLCSPTPPCEESLPSIHTLTASKPDLPTPPDSLSGKDEFEAEATNVSPSATDSSTRDPAQTLLLKPIDFQPASYRTFEEEMVVLRKRPHVETLGDLHMRRKRVVLELPYARIPPQDDDGRDLVGFHNPAFWCYRRALTQSLMNLSRFGDYLRNHRELYPCTLPNGPLHPKPCLLEVLADLYEACKRRKKADVAHQTSELDKALRTLSFAYGKAWVRAHAQQDAFELLQFLMIDNLFDRFNRPTSVLQGLFSVRRVVHGQCTACHAWSTPVAHDDLGLTLPMNPDNDDTPIYLEELIDYDFAEEEVEVNCDACGLKKGARRSRLQMISAAPEILAIQLSRFSFSAFAQEGEKNNRKVHIPMTLDMSPYLNRPTLQAPHNLLYRLNSTVCHSGELNSGHYICYANKGGLMQEKVYRFDDSTKPEKVKTSELANPPKSYGNYSNWTPYILFYECIKSPALALDAINDNNENIYRPRVPSVEAVSKAVGRRTCY